MIAESLSALASGLTFWKDREKDGRAEKRLRNRAIGVVMDAAIATKAYLRDRELGLPEDREKEHSVARLWQSAAQVIDEYDYQLFNSAKLKALGWADPREWRRVEGRKWTVNIDKIIEQCEWLQRNG